MRAIGQFWKSSVAYILGTAFLRLLPVALLPLISRQLSSAELGVLELVLSYIFLAQIITTLSMEASVGRFFYADGGIPDQRSVIVNAVSLVIACGCLAGLGVFLLAGPISSVTLPGSEDVRLIELAAAMMFFGALINILTAILRFLSEVRLFLLVSVGFSLVTAILVWLLIVNQGHGIAGYLVAHILVYFTTSIGLLSYLAWRGLLSARLDRKVMSVLLLYGLPIMPGVIATWLNLHGARALSSAWLSLEAIGIFSVAARLASVIKLLEEGLKMIWSPYLFSALSKPDHQAGIRAKFMVIAVLTFTGAGVLQMIGYELYEVMLPETYEPGFPVFCILVANFSLTAMIQLVLIGPVIVKRTWINSAIIGCGSALGLSVLYVLLPAFGLFAPAMSMLISTIFILSGSWLVTEKMYPIGFPVPFFLVCVGGLAISTICAILFSEATLLRCAIALVILGAAGRWLYRNLQFITSA